MSIFGRISGFDVHSSWTFYTEHIDVLLGAKIITDNKTKRATSLTVSGTKILNMVKLLFYLNKSSEMSFEETISALQNIFIFWAKDSTFYSRLHIHKRIQRNDGSLFDYITVLRRLVEKCNFESTFK